MPFYYDLNKAVATNGTSATENTHYWVRTVANQETASLVGVYAAAQFATAGGAQLRVKANTGTVASGGTSVVFNPKNLRGNPAAQTLINTTSTSTFGVGTTLLTRLTIGFAQTGGMGGYVPIVPSAAIQLMPNTTNPVDVEFCSIATSPTVAFDLTVEIAEGI